MNQKLILVFSLIVGLLAFGLSIRYFQSRFAAVERARADFEKRVRTVEVVAAARDIPQGVTIGKDDIGHKPMYQIEMSAREDVVLAAEARYVIGRKAMFNIQKGDSLNWSFLEGGERTGQDLASTVTPGMRALSIAVGGAAAVSSMVRPDDHIDVLGTFTFPSKAAAGEMETVTLTVLQDVTVLATGQQLANDARGARPSSRAAGYSTVTLEVTPREAELIVFAQQLNGRLTLSLRNRSDVNFESELPSVNFDRLQESLPELNTYRQRTIRHKTNL
ncbi:MAG: Flp pilus assembly protein CpaB [Lentisphaerae bacterium]|nr:Flp pilus assembly protein CpaB [Lentisphaerota bacterium]